MLDYAAIATALLDIVHRSASPEQGWTALLEEAERHGTVPPELRGWDVLDDVVTLRGEVAGVLEREPIPPGIRLVYFGLFDAWDEETDDPVAGFSIGGAAGKDELAEGRLPYLPESRYVTARLLDAIQAAPARGEYDVGLMQYALVWAAAALLVKHGTGRLLDRYTVVVGFDEGDRMVLRTADLGQG